MAAPEILGTTKNPDSASSGAFKRLSAAMAGLVLLAGLATMLVWNPAVRPGSQLPQPSASLRPASGGSWNALESEDESRGPDFPPPMVRRSEDVCIGFGRVDFSADERRPSLARCVAGTEIETLRENGLVTLATVTSGHDTWHFVEVGAELRSVTLTLEEDELLTADRIYVYGSTLALRLLNNIDLQRIEWSTIHGTYRCTPASGAWSNSQFCSAS